MEQAHTDSNCNSVVLEVQNSRECLVSITHNGVLKFENSKLRPHQDWLDGNWVMSSKVKHSEASPLYNQFVFVFFLSEIAINIDYSQNLRDNKTSNTKACQTLLDLFRLTFYFRL